VDASISPTLLDTLQGEIPDPQIERMDRCGH